MPRTASKSRNSIKKLTEGLDKTERKQPKNREMFVVTSTTIHLNTIMIPAILREGAWNRRDLVWTPRSEMQDEGRRDQIKEKFLRIGRSSALRINRARVFDWLIDVCRGFGFRWQTYWYTIEILDYLIVYKGVVDMTNIHLFSVTCLYIGCKIHEVEFDNKLLKLLVDKAAYHAFPAEQVVWLESQILLSLSNTQQRPDFLSTIYTTFYEMYPSLPVKLRTEILRRLVLIWMDPPMAFNMDHLHEDRENQFYVLYTDLITMMVRQIQDEKENIGLQNVRKHYWVNYECENLDPFSNSLEKLRP